MTAIDGYRIYYKLTTGSTRNYHTTADFSHHSYRRIRIAEACCFSNCSHCAHENDINNILQHTHNHNIHVNVARACDVDQR